MSDTPDNHGLWYIGRPRFELPIPIHYPTPEMEYILYTVFQNLKSKVVVQNYNFPLNFDSFKWKEEVLNSRTFSYQKSQIIGFLKRICFALQIENTIHSKALTICIMLEAEGWGPGCPLISSPRATWARSSLCNWVASLFSASSKPRLVTFPQFSLIFPFFVEKKFGVKIRHWKRGTEQIIQS